MRALILASAFVALAVGQGNAACFGTSNSYSCNDLSFGNQTNVNGYSVQTGSSWSQNSMTFGNMNITNEMTIGRGLNETLQNFGGGMRTIYGVDSDGRSLAPALDR